MALIFDASFRGVPFEVRAASDQHGRTVVLHEYPHRAAPYPEDMGRAARLIEVNGFVCGNAWQARRNALVAAFDTEGPGTLVHPWYGEITVSLNGPVKFSYQGGVDGEASFNAVFVETNDTNYPDVSPHNQSLAAIRSALCLDMAAAWLDSACILAGQASTVVSAIISEAQSVARVVEKVQQGDLLGAGSELSALLGLDGSGIADLVNQGLGLSALLTPIFTGWDTSAKQSEATVAMLAIAAAAPQISKPAAPGATALSSWKARAAIANFQREAATIEALKAASLAVPATRLEESKLRESVFEAVENCLLNTDNPELAGELRDLRRYALAALAENGSAAPDVITVSESATLPSLVVAYRQIVRESGRVIDLLEAESDLLDRNTVSHPGFVPGGKPLEALRYAR